ncbi:hypothetical protein [Biostraticola tofi]|nr:hypothetical protein [Biostraticola tofi]
MKKRRPSHRFREYQETLNDAQFAIAVLIIASVTLISFIIVVTLWII